MSELFNALKRGGRRDEPARSPGRAARADAVLATLGYRKPKPNSHVVPLAVAVAAICLAGVVAWMLWPSPNVPRAASAAAARSQPAAPRMAPPPVPVDAPPAAARVPPAVAQVPPALPDHAASPAPASSSSAPAAPPAAAPPATAALPSVQTRPPADARAPRQPPAIEQQPAAPSTAGDRPSAELFSLAVYNHRAGDFEAARTAYLSLLARNEMDPRVHNNLGLLYREQGMLDYAVREFQRALIVNPDYLTARNNLGVTLLGQSRLADAAAEFNRVLAEDPRNVDAVVNLALVEKASGRAQRAAESLLRALVIDPRNAPAHFNLASLYEQEGETARAADHYRAFLELAGDEHASRAAEARARLAAIARAPD